MQIWFCTVCRCPLKGTLGFIWLTRVAGNIEKKDTTTNLFLTFQFEVLDFLPVSLIPHSHLAAPYNYALNLKFSQAPCTHNRILNIPAVPPW